MTQDLRIGKRGSAVVQWQNGRETVTEGLILHIDEQACEVFLETSFGNVAGDLGTLEMDDETSGNAGEGNR